MNRKIFFLCIMLFCVLFLLFACKSEESGGAVGEQNGQAPVKDGVSDISNGGNASQGTAYADNAQGSSEPDPRLSVTYEQFCNMNAEEQKAHIYSFDSPDDFFLWYNSAKDAYEETREAGAELTGPIDFEDIAGGSN